MKNSAKVQVWLAAMIAIQPDVRFGQKLLIASDVALALGFKTLICDGGFELVRIHDKTNPCSRFTRLAFVKE